MSSSGPKIFADGVVGTQRQRVSKNAILIILVVISVLCIVAIVVFTVVTIQRVQRNASPANVALVEKARGKFTIVIPTDRIVEASVPKVMKRVNVSNNPIVDLYHHFLTDAEADHVIRVAGDRFRPSTTMSNDVNSVNKDRTSTSVFLNSSSDAKDDVLKHIISKAAKVANVPASYLEPLQVVRYDHGQFYRQHYDYLDESSSEVKNHGQRTITLLVYLNTLPEEETGGGTKFHVLDHVVKPEKGAGLLWHNVTSLGNVDARTLHSGEPLNSKGSVKYAMNIWFRDRPQEDRK
jgi:prolyl 4-hydroxylase